MIARLLIVLALCASAAAHSFLSVPTPMTHTETCRIGGNPGFRAHCTGPCPNPQFRPRYDMQPENPSATWERGETVTIHYTKNNHDGGFVRLALVPIDEMYSKSVHQFMAFYYGCWSSHQRFSCSPHEHHRDCGFDRQNLAWKVSVTIPTVYPDGVYALGWSWYGGGETFGSFGDYYDCAFVRIRGGPLTDKYNAEFRPGPLYKNGCQASVDRLGICVTEPCGQQLWSREMIPMEFQNGPPVLERKWYEDALNRSANQITVAESTEFGVTKFVLFDTGNEMRLNVNLDDFVDITYIRGITILPEYFGKVERIEWVVNGKREADRHEWPFSIGDSQVEGDRHNFFDWPHPLTDQRMLVTAIAHSNGQRAYYSKDLYFWRR